MPAEKLTGELFPDASLANPRTEYSFANNPSQLYFHQQTDTSGLFHFLRYVTNFNSAIVIHELWRTGRYEDIATIGQLGLRSRPVSPVNNRDYILEQIAALGIGSRDLGGGDASFDLAQQEMFVREVFTAAWNGVRYVAYDTALDDEGKAFVDKAVGQIFPVEEQTAEVVVAE